MLRQQLSTPGIAVESAGLAALVGNPVDPLAESVLLEHGLSAATHVARQVTPALIGAADLVLAMDKRHVSAVHALVPHARGKTFLLGRWDGGVEVPDPYGKPRTEFERAHTLIERAVGHWRQHI